MTDPNGTPTGGLLCTIADVEEALRRPLDKGTGTDAEPGPERSYAEDQLIPALSEIIEGYLMRCFGQREVVELLTPVNGVLYPTKLPLISVTSVVDDTNSVVPATMWDNERIDVGQLYPQYGMNWQAQSAPDPQSLAMTVTYQAGLPVVPKRIRKFVAGSVARTILTPVQIEAGIIASYSVEGTSISYEPARFTSDEDRPTGFTISDLSAISDLRNLAYGLGL